MSMKSIFVVGTALVMSATLNAQAQKPQPAPRVTKEKPAQSQPPEWVPKEFNRLGFDFSLFKTPLQGRVVKGAPYSAVIETESIQTLGDGNRIVHRSTARVYRDAEGRVRREEDPGGANPSITITDPVGDKSFTLDPVARTARQTVLLPLFDFYLRNLPVHAGDYWFVRDAATGYRTAARATGTVTVDGSGTQGTTSVTLGRGGRGGRGVPGRDEYVEEPLPNRTIEGVVASGIRRTTTIPQGAIGNEQPIKTVSEEWTAVDLKVLVLTETTDPRTGRSTYRLVNIIRADPDPALFKVPADYTLLGRGRGGK